MTIELGVSIIIYIIIGLYLRREVKALKGELASQKSTLTSQETLLNNFKTSMDAIDTHFKNYREIFDIPKLKDFVEIREETITAEKEKELDELRQSTETDIQRLKSQLQESRSTIQLDGDGSEIPRELLLTNFSYVALLFSHSLWMWIRKNGEFLDLVGMLLELRPTLINGGFSSQKFAMIIKLLLDQSDASKAQTDLLLKVSPDDLYRYEIELPKFVMEEPVESLAEDFKSFSEQLKKILESEPPDLENVSPQN